MAFDLDPSYKQVPERLADFKEKHPDGCLRPADPSRPYWIEVIGDQTFIVYAAAAYRAPDDPTPGIGLAWESFPGRTPYTKGSELQNAETSAWGRAIVAVLASESKSVASAEDVRNRQADHAEPERQRKAPVAASEPLASAEDHQSIRNLIESLEDKDRSDFTRWWRLQILPSIKTQDALTEEQASLVFDHFDLIARVAQSHRDAVEAKTSGGVAGTTSATPDAVTPPVTEFDDEGLPEAVAAAHASRAPELLADRFPGAVDDETGELLPTGGSPATARRVMEEAKARKPAGVRGNR